MSLSQNWTDYQKYIHRSRYARWLDDEGRRENWEETVGRYFEFFLDSTSKDGKGYQELGNNLKKLEDAVLNHEVMPSMRCLMAAGKALERDNVAGFNCSYVAVDNVRCFDEIMYILMCGTGVGFSVERQSISRLPTIPDVVQRTGEVLRVRDSKIGWCEAFRRLLSRLYQGEILGWDTSGVRSAGSRLKTFGGRSSGPAPLEHLFQFTVDLFERCRGRRLTSIEVHDLVCKIGDIVVVGGVRRSALISLSNLSDDRMRDAKSGAWWDHSPHRALANNSAVYTEKPELSTFLKEWSSLYESKSGERGIFSRVASQHQAAKNKRRRSDYAFGTNPCSEIILRSCQFCNLTEVVVRPDDTLDDLRRKVRQATILGTLQSSLTDFRYLRKIWKDNTEEEALLGVSLTGIMDHPVLSGQDIQGIDGEWESLPETLEILKNEAIKTNKKWAKILGVNASTAITCVKPSGTVSQLVDSSSGIHSRFSEFYIRRVRADKKDPLATFLIDSGVSYEEDKMNPSVWVFSFPQKAPEGAQTVSEDTAIGQLELWKIYQEHWCEHKPSITVYYNDSEFLGVGDWVYRHFDAVSGVSFLPRSDHTYEQAPYETIDEGAYKEMVKTFPKINWEAFDSYEKEDNTTGSQELACSGGVCEL
jgi:ribonucleoside-diphosphate reductase alpha chain